jgi:tRNA (guanine-N7-)-methyltransferase
MSFEYPEEHKKQLQRLTALLNELPVGDYVLELGCGHGHFLSALAVLEKGARNYVGVDKKHDRLARGQKKSDRIGMKVHWIWGSAGDVLDCWPENRIVRDCFVLFPDPWPKKRHWKHRFVNAAFLSSLARIWAPRSRLFFRTDHEGYFSDVWQLISESSLWQIDPVVQWPGPLPQTVFEEHHPRFDSLIAVLK